MTSGHYDALETRDPELRAREQFARLRAQIAHAKARTDVFARALSHVDAESITTPEALARLPVIRKSELGATAPPLLPREPEPEFKNV